MKKKKALIFGITGQDGGYLSKFLLSKNYKVFGITRSKKKSNLINLEKLEIKKKINLILSKNLKKDQINQIISKTLPDEIYYLAGQSSVGLSFMTNQQHSGFAHSGWFFVKEIRTMVHLP